jgi:hypothetical protein
MKLLSIYKLTNTEGNMTTLLNIDATQVAHEATLAADKAKDAYLTKWKESTGGNEYGEPMYCGFGWVQCTPEHKGNTRLGKQERAVLEAMGFKKDWTGKSYQLWNAGGYAGQSMDVKEAACDAYAGVLNSYGVKAHACSRAD